MTTRKNYLVNGTLYAKGRCYAPDREYTNENDFTAYNKENAIKQFKKWIMDFNGVEEEEVVKLVINECYCNGKERRVARYTTIK